jgi:molybdate transport system permease protein
LGGLLVLYLGVPLVAFAVRFFRTSDRGFSTPGLYPALSTSLLAATISLALITLFGVPLAYYLAHSKSRLSKVVGVVVQIPLALPPVMAGIVLIYIVGPYTGLGELFGRQLTQSVTGIVIAMTFTASPFLVVAARASFAAIDQGLLDVASTLGHSDVSRFLRVSIPLAGPGIRAGMTLSWLRAFGEYGAVVILAYNPASLPVYTYNQFSSTGLPTTLAPTALALGVAVVVVILSTVHVRGRRAPAVLPAPTAPQPLSARPVGFDIHHRLGTFTLDVEHPPNVKHLSVLGESGSGKSTLLRCIAGLFGAAPGEVWFGPDLVSGKSVESRRVGYVAQGFSLFPHLTVWQHLLFAKGATPGIASHWLARLGLVGLEDRLPAQLSGGERQRVALAQVLCHSPEVLLLDEPLSSLDTPVRRELRRELRRLQQETDIPTVVVTHDPDEAAFLAEEVIVMARGVSLQSGPTNSVYERPRSAEVAGLLGIANVFDATALPGGQLDTNGTVIAASDSGLANGSSVQWSVRPERVSVRAVSRTSPDGPPGALAGTVTDVADLGSRVELVVRIAEDFEIESHVATAPSLSVGDHCEVWIDAESVSVWSLSPVG